MRTLKTALAVLAMLALLAGCGVVAEPVATTEPATEAIKTTEADSTTIPLARSGENGIVWRELDRYDEVYDAEFDWLRGKFARQPRGEFEPYTEDELAEKAAYEKELAEAKALIIDIPEADMGTAQCRWERLSPDARYYLVAEQSAVRVFNLQENEFAGRIPVENVGYEDLGEYGHAQAFRIAFKNDNIVYLYEVLNEEVCDFLPMIHRYALEITLP